MKENSTCFIHPFLHFDLSDAQCKKVIEGAVRILNEKGIQSYSKIVQNFLSKTSGICISNNRIYFEKDFVEDYINRMRTSYKPEKDNEHFCQRPPWSSLNIADLKTGMIRIATEDDLVKAVKLYEGMGIYNGVPPVVVGTVEPRYRNLFSTKVCLQNSKSFGDPMDISNEKEFEVFIKMFEVVERKPNLLVELIINPLKFNDKKLEFLLRHREEKRISIHIGAGMPCCGSTAPLIFPAAFSLAIAESLAASIFTHLCTGRYPMIEANLGLFDFRYTNYVVGSPEWFLLDMASRRLHSFITGHMSRYGSLLTLAHWPDAHAIHDHTISAILQGLQGARVFSGSGQLSHDEVFNPEIVVIDKDILGAAERLVKGIEWEEDFDRTLGIIYEGLDRGHFLDHDTTLNKFRSFSFMAELFEEMNLDQWRKNGSVPLLKKASKMVDCIVKEYDFKRPKDQIRELERIYQHAIKEL